MVAFNFNLEPRTVAKVETKYRKIVTPIPVPESLPFLQAIKKYESTNALEQLPVLWDRADNALIYDKWDNCWIDFTSSIFVTNSGHGNNRVTRNIKHLLDKPLLHSYYYPTEIRRTFLEKLIGSTPANLEKAIILSVGTEATERAMKIARIRGGCMHKGKNILVAGMGNYHGKTMGAQMLSGQPKDKEWIGYQDPNIVHLPFPYPWILEEFEGNGEDLFHKHLDELREKRVVLENIAAFFVESFQGWGAIFYPSDYIKAMRNWASMNGSLLVFDEIQAGFGRTGKLFAYEHYDVEADLVICGKGISGSLPLSAVLGSAELIEMDAGYTSTHGGNPLACAAGLGNLEAFEELDLVNEAARKEQVMRDVIDTWKEKYPNRIGRVHGKGLLFGVFITDDNKDSLDQDLTNRICERAMEKGVFSICTGRGTLKIGPPLTIPDDALREGLSVYEECFEELF